MTVAIEELTRCRCAELPSAERPSAAAGLVAATVVRDHGAWPTCTSVALATVAEAHTLAGSGRESELSVFHNYWWARSLVDRTGQWGSRFEWALVAAAVKGWVTEHACPANAAAIDLPPDATAGAAASPSLVARRLRLARCAEADAATLVRALERGCPVVLDVPICGALWEVAPDGELARAPGAARGRHVVVAYALQAGPEPTGYAGVWVRGSWGKAWGKQGDALMPLAAAWLSSVCDMWLVLPRPAGCRCHPIVAGTWQIGAGADFAEAADVR